MCKTQEKIVIFSRSRCSKARPVMPGLDNTMINDDQFAAAQRAACTVHSCSAEHCGCIPVQKTRGRRSGQRIQKKRGSSPSSASVCIPVPERPPVSSDTAFEPDMVRKPDDDGWKEVKYDRARVRTRGPVRNKGKGARNTARVSVKSKPIAEFSKWNGTSYKEVPVTSIRRVTDSNGIPIPDENGRLQFEAFVGTVLVLPFVEVDGTDDGIVACPFQHHERQVIEWEWVCPRWIEWCLERGVFLLMDKIDEQQKCTHRHMGTHQACGSTAPICHKLNATQGTCGNKCPGIHIMYPDGHKIVSGEEFNFEGNFVDMIDAYSMHLANMEKERQINLLIG